MTIINIDTLQMGNMNVLGKESPITATQTKMTQLA